MENRKKNPEIPQSEYKVKSKSKAITVTSRGGL
jgi:hypothetical protein